MPKYKITDESTGRSVVVVADSQPTSSEAEEILAHIKSQYSEVPKWGQENPRLYGVAGAARETLGPLLEMGGMTAGSIIGSSSGPVGSVVGAGLGYGGAKSLTNQADVWLGNRPDPGMAQATKEGVTNLAEGATYEAGGQSLFPLISAGFRNVPDAVMSTLTGVGDKTYSRIFNAGRQGGSRSVSVADNMRGLEAMSNVVDDAKGALTNISRDRTDRYLLGMSKIKSAKDPVDFSLIDDAFNDLVDAYKVEGTWKAGEATQNTFKQIDKTLKEFRANPKLHNAYGIDALKQRIDDLMPNKLEGNKSAAVVTEMYNKIRNIITSSSPDYAKVMRDFEKSISQTKAIKKELSLGNSASESAALRKLQSISRNNVNTGYGNREIMAKYLEDNGGANILDRIAGQQVSTILPRGLSRTLAGGTGIAATANPQMLALLPFMSPRLMGELSLLAGQASRSMPPMPGDITRAGAATMYGINGLLGD